jgi:hypothetical protein
VNLLDVRCSGSQRADATPLLQDVAIHSKPQHFWHECNIIFVGEIGGLLMQSTVRLLSEIDFRKICEMWVSSPILRIGERDVI